MKPPIIILFLFFGIPIQTVFAQLPLSSSQENTKYYSTKDTYHPDSDNEDSKSKENREPIYDATFQRCEAGNITVSTIGAQSGEYYIWEKNGDIIKTSIGNQDNKLTLWVNENTELIVFIMAQSNIKSTKRILVKVSPNPKPYVYAEKSSSVCLGEKVTLIAGGGKMYQWQNAVVSLNEENSYVQSYPIQQNQQIQVTAYNEFGCRATANIQLSLLQSPSAPIVSSYQTRCGKGNLLLTVKGSTGQYKWYSEYHATQPVCTRDTFSVFLDNAHTYFVTAVGANGCESARHGAITTGIIYPNPSEPEVVHSEFSKCYPDSIVFEVKNLNSSISLEWFSQKTQTLIKTSQNSNDRFLTQWFDKSDTILVRISNNYSQCKSASKAIPVSISPVNAPTKPNNPSLCTLGSTTFSVEPVSGIQYNWYTSPYENRPISSNGSSSVNQAQIERMVTEVNSNNQYSLWCEAVDAQKGCVSAKTQVTATYFPLPTLSLNSNYKVCSNENLTLNPLNTQGDFQLKWYELTPIPTLLNTAASFTIPSYSEGQKQFSVIINDLTTGCNSELNEHIFTVDYFQSNKVPSVQENVSCGITTLTAFGANNQELYIWKDATNSIIGNTSSITLAAGLLSTSISVEISNTACLNSQIQLNPRFVIIPEAPAAENLSICSGTSITLSVPFNNAYTINWYNAQGGLVFSGGNKYNTPVLNSTTEYFVSYVNQNGCESARTQIQVIVYSKPQISAPNRICPGALTELKGSNAQTYSWYQDGVYIGNGSSMYVNPTISTTFTLVDISNTSSCNSSSIQISPSFKYCLDQQARSVTENAHVEMVYPNPFTSETEFILENFEVGTSVEITNLEGHIISNFIAQQAHSSIGQDLQSGVYLLKIHYPSGKEKTARLIKL